jgi:hypothetical protein
VRTAAVSLLGEAEFAALHAQISRASAGGQEEQEELNSDRALRQTARFGADKPVERWQEAMQVVAQLVYLESQHGSGG